MDRGQVPKDGMYARHFVRDPLAVEIRRAGLCQTVVGQKRELCHFGRAPFIRSVSMRDQRVTAGNIPRFATRCAPGSSGNSWPKFLQSDSARTGPMHSTPCTQSRATWAESLPRRPRGSRISKRSAARQAPVEARVTIGWGEQLPEEVFPSRIVPDCLAPGAWSPTAPRCPTERLASPWARTRWAS